MRRPEVQSCVAAILAVSAAGSGECALISVVILPFDLEAVLEVLQRPRHSVRRPIPT